MKGMDLPVQMFRAVAVIDANYYEAPTMIKHSPDKTCIQNFQDLLKALLKLARICDKNVLVKGIQESNSKTGQHMKNIKDENNHKEK